MLTSVSAHAISARKIKSHKGREMCWYNEHWKVFSITKMVWGLRLFESLIRHSLLSVFGLPVQIIYIIRIKVRSPISSGWINGERGQWGQSKWFSIAQKLSTTSNSGIFSSSPRLRGRQFITTSTWTGIADLGAPKRKAVHYYFSMDWDSRFGCSLRGRQFTTTSAWTGIRDLSISMFFPPF